MLYYRRATVRWGVPVRHVSPAAHNAWMDRKHIVEEIRRTAAANGGVPLGSHRFYAETGIRRRDWLGKYWARWGDALREAGLAPNSLQGAYDDAFLLEKLATLTRELGSFPVREELRLKTRRDSTFPSHSTFDRFGGKHDLVDRLVRYCTESGGYDDVLAICSAIERLTPEPKVPDPADAAFGFVYLLKSGRYYKIGRTNAAGRRERELAIQLPEPTALIHSIKTDDPVGIERYWHGRFESRRKGGEWFALTAEDVVAFKRRKFM